MDRSRARGLAAHGCAIAFLAVALIFGLAGTWATRSGPSDVSSSSPSPAPSATAPNPSPSPSSVQTISATARSADPATTAPPTSRFTRDGIIAQSTLSADYLAIPIGPGKWVRICGPADCLERRSTDAGPNHDMLVAGRIADLNLSDWLTICGLPRDAGLCPGSWTLIGRPGATPPATDVDPTVGPLVPPIAETNPEAPMP